MALPPPLPPSASNPDRRKRTILGIAVTLPLILIGLVIALPVLIWVFLAVVFVAHDVTKSVKDSVRVNNAPPAAPPVQMTTPPGGFRPPPMATQPTAEEWQAKMRSFGDPQTTKPGE
jgi:hypothetical protein